MNIYILREYVRMCISYDSCIDCPLSITGVEESCKDYILTYSEEATEIVQKWAKEHPLKTYAQDFFKRFPNAPTELNGTPRTCVENVYGLGHGNCSGKCSACWNREYKEKEE